MKPSVGFVCLPGLSTFIKPISDHFRSQYDVMTCYDDTKYLGNVFDRSDIIWLEWANDLAIQATHKIQQTHLDKKYTICRLHSYEAFTGMYKNVDWRYVNTVIFIAQHILEMCVDHIKTINPNINVCLIPNGIDTNKLRFEKPKTYQHNIAYTGLIHARKCPELMVQAFYELLQKNDRYTLHVAGTIQEPRYEYYLKHILTKLKLKDKIKFHGWVDDLTGFYQNIDHIIITSSWEGQHVGCSDAMACGIQPAIHHFLGASRVYDSKYVWATIDDFIKIVDNNKPDPDEYRQFILDNYSNDLIQPQLKQIIENGRT